MKVNISSEYLDSSSSFAMSRIMENPSENEKVMKFHKDLKPKDSNRALTPVVLTSKLINSNNLRNSKFLSSKNRNLKLNNFFIRSQRIKKGNFTARRVKRCLISHPKIKLSKKSSVRLLFFYIRFIVRL